MSENEYKSIDLQDFFHGLDIEKLKKTLTVPPQEKPPKIKTLDFLLNSLDIGRDITYPDLFLRNYIYTTIIVRKHLREISARQRDVEKRLKKVDDKGSYLLKKLQYFYTQNQSAKDKIIKFISYELSNYMANIDHPYSDLIDRDKEEHMWIFGPIYNYQYTSHFYDPDYDFSTYAKFYNVPGVGAFDFMENIERHIALKRDCPDAYYREVIKIVDDNNMVSQMSSRVSFNYHIHETKEIFEALVTLFEEKRYLAFITMASIQLEGIFYELVCIKFGAKERQGTLVEKVEKAFKSDPHLMQTLYPYFAFDIPELRNEIAHKGIVHGCDLKLTAYELVLDLNCVLYLTERASTDKFNKFFTIHDKLNKVKNTGDTTAYRTEMCSCILGELYMSKMIHYEFLWDLLVSPEDYDDELDYYRPQNLGEGDYCLKDIVYQISDLVKDDIFWSVVLSVCDDILSTGNGSNMELIHFIEMLKNCFIDILSGNAKRTCCQVNPKIEAIKEQFRNSRI